MASASRIAWTAVPSKFGAGTLAAALRAIPVAAASLLPLAAAGPAHRVPPGKRIHPSACPDEGTFEPDPPGRLALLWHGWLHRAVGAIWQAADRPRLLVALGRGRGASAKARHEVIESPYRLLSGSFPPGLASSSMRRSIAPELEVPKPAVAPAEAPPCAALAPRRPGSWKAFRGVPRRTCTGRVPVARGSVSRVLSPPGSGTVCSDALAAIGAPPGQEWPGASPFRGNCTWDLGFAQHRLTRADACISAP